MGIVSACQSTGLAPTGDRVVGAVGCTVVFPGPDHIDTTGVVWWEYKQNENITELSVVLYYVESWKLDILPAYKDRIVFNMSNWSLGLKLQLADRGLYRLRREEEDKSGKWIQLEVIESQVPSSSSLMVAGGRNFLTEPLSKSELFRNSSLAGCTTEMVCNVTVGRVDSYLWSKDHKPLPGTDHYQLSRKTMEVSENETSLELAISDSSAVVSDGVILGIAVRTAVVSLVMADGDLHSE
ncbi:unnamed protein product [Caretta caretta]